MFISTDYVEEIYQFYTEAHANKLLEGGCKELLEMTPANMDTMLSAKQSKEDALKKKKARESMVVEDVPPTMTSTVFHFSVAISVQMTVQYFLLFYDLVIITSNTIFVSMFVFFNFSIR